MIVRREQMQTLEEVRSPDFEDFMVQHLIEFSPLHSRSLGKAGVRILVTLGMERAKAHGFTHRGPVKFYIETMILLGAEFDTDPQYPWAGAILRDLSIPDQTERADRIHALLLDLLDKAGGHNREHATRALRRARDIPFRPVAVSAPDFEQQMIRAMRENHPEKADYVGEAALKALIPRAVDEATRYSVATDGGVCLFLGLMFAVGHGFARDPKYPWIVNTLSNPAITDPGTRVQRLYSKAMTYLDHVLQHVRGG